MTRIIGLTGAAGAGKDTVAAIIDKLSADDAFMVSISFAAPIRSMVAMLLEHWDVQANALTDRVLKETEIAGIGASPRKLMQTLGTEWGRNLISQTLWIDTAERGIRKAIEYGYIVVITDVRFPNEADLIHRLGGVVWKIDRPGIECVAAHASETGLPATLIDRVIDNSGTLQDLVRAVEFELRQQPLFGEVAA